MQIEEKENVKQIKITLHKEEKQIILNLYT